MNHIMTMLRLINFSSISKSADLHLDLYRNLAPKSEPEFGAIKQFLCKNILDLYPRLAKIFSTCKNILDLQKYSRLVSKNILDLYRNLAPKPKPEFAAIKQFLSKNISFQ